MKILMTIIGFVAIAAGLTWVGQGLGIITWHPASMPPSFMVGDKNWVYYGSALALLGSFILWRSRR
jgi:hypothetical protein